jgi:molybdenum cofactor cytidylyltransferase
MDVLGKPLDDSHIHRSALVSRLTNVPLGVPVTLELISRVLTSPLGGLRNKPDRSRVIPLLNKVEDADSSARAGELATMLLRTDEIFAVASGAVKKSESPISAVYARVAAVILAAGGSSRMGGEFKQLLPWRDTTFVGNAVQVAAKSSVFGTVVVTGSNAHQVREHLNGAGARVVNNPDWTTGRASSVRVGIAAIDDKCAAAIFINADQPFLTPDVIDALLARYFETRAPIVAATYNGETASPVLIARKLFSELAWQQGEQGGRDLLLRHSDKVERVAIPDLRAALDLDTPEEYEAARKLTDGA